MVCRRDLRRGRRKENYGRDNWLDGKKYMVEFVSANPTGPMHMGNARGGVLGDTLAEVLDWSGAKVWREFYVNDFGNQIEKFAKSIEARSSSSSRARTPLSSPRTATTATISASLPRRLRPSRRELP